MGMAMFQLRPNGLSFKLEYDLEHGVVTCMHLSAECVCASRERIAITGYTSKQILLPRQSFLDLDQCQTGLQMKYRIRRSTGPDVNANIAATAHAIMLRACRSATRIVSFSSLTSSRASGHASWQPEKRVNDRAGSLADELGYLNALGIRRDFEEERTEAVREIGFRLVTVLSRRH